MRIEYSHVSSSPIPRRDRFCSTQPGAPPVEIFAARHHSQKYEATLRRSQALTPSLINSTRPRQSESRVCGYRPGYSLHLRIHKGQAYIPRLMRRAALRERTPHRQPHLSRRIYTRDTDADNLNTADRCPFVRRSTYDRVDGSVSRPLLSRDYDLVSPKAGYRSDGSDLFLFL